MNSPINEVGKPLAIISDLDDTLILSDPYWSYLIKHDLEFFDDSVWDEWVASDQATPSPGALEFLNFCEENNISVFYTILIEILLILLLKRISRRLCSKLS